MGKWLRFANADSVLLLSNRPCSCPTALGCGGPGSFAITTGNIRFSRVAMRPGGFGLRLQQPTRRPFVGSWLRAQWLTSPIGSLTRRQKME